MKYNWFTMFQVYRKVIQIYIYIHIYVYKCVYLYILFQSLFHYRLLQDTEYSSLCYTVGPCCLSILYIVVYILRRNQDGRVEGRALTPSCENTRITTSCWTIIDRKTLELTRKDTPHPKTKEKPQWDGRRGAITVKSNPITTGWVTHRLANTYTTEVHPLEWRFWAPRQLPNLGVPQWEQEFLENQTLKPSGNWLQDFDRTGGNRDSTLGGHTRSSVHIGTQGKEQWPRERLNQTYLLVLEGPLQSRGGCGSPWGQGHWQQKFWEVLLGVSLPRVCH